MPLLDLSPHLALLIAGYALINLATAAGLAVQVEAVRVAYDF